MICWNFPLSGITFPFGLFLFWFPLIQIPILPSACVRERRCSLSDWFVFTSGVKRDDEELMACTCKAFYLKQKCSVHVTSVSTLWQVCACMHASSAYGFPQTWVHMLVYLCVLWERQKYIDERKERDALCCIMMVSPLQLGFYTFFPWFIGGKKCVTLLQLFTDSCNTSCHD